MSRWATIVATASAVAATVLIGLGDYATGIYVSVSPLYLLPIAGTAWWLGARSAAIVVMTATLAWYGAEYGWEYDFPPLVSLWNAVTRGIVFGVVAALIVGLRRRGAELATARDALASALEHEERNSRTDPLTGLLNRRGFSEALTRAMRGAMTGFTVAYLDIDDFKQLNDSEGHEAGDALLVELAAGLQDACRARDVVARLGGDEFALLFLDTTPEMAEAALRRVVGVVGEIRLPHHRPAGMSIGIVHFPNGAGTPAEVLTAADAAMYKAKRTGKGHVVRGPDGGMAPGVCPGR